MGVDTCFIERPAQSVRNGPGSIRLTRIPNGVSSRDSASVSPSSANLLAL